MHCILLPAGARPVQGAMLQDAGALVCSRVISVDMVCRSRSRWYWTHACRLDSGAAWARRGVTASRARWEAPARPESFQKTQRRHALPRPSSRIGIARGAGGSVLHCHAGSGGSNRPELGISAQCRSGSCGWAGGTAHRARLWH